MAKTRSKLTRRLEDYLEAVYVLMAETGSARVRDIAARTGVSMSSVSAALRQLADGGLVHYDPYELVTLTPAGEAQAGRIRGKHEALADFLGQVLGVGPQTADANACRMEHVVSDDVLDRLALLSDFLGRSPARGQSLAKRFAAYCRRREAAASGRKHRRAKGSDE